MHDEFYSLTGKLRNILKSLHGFSFVGGRVRLHVGNLTRVWVALPCGRNLSSMDIAKCEPQVFRLEKTLKIGKNITNAEVLVWVRQILENSS